MNADKEKQSTFIEELYQEMNSLLYNYAWNALNDRLLGEEAVQETFRIACEKIDVLMNSTNPKGWLMNTHKNVISNIIRVRATINKVIIYSATFDEKITGAIIDEVDPELLYTGVVAKEDIRLLKLIVLERYSLLETAEELGISVEACKKRAQRAKKKFRKILQEL